MADFDFGDKQQPDTQTPYRASSRAQVAYPIDPEGIGAVRAIFGMLWKELNQVQSVTLLTGQVTFSVRNSDVMNVIGAAAVTIATITNGYNGQVLKLIFNDANVTITDTSTGAKNTINLSAAFTGTANDVLTLVSNGTSWFEVSRSTN